MGILKKANRFTKKVEKEAEADYLKRKGEFWAEYQPLTQKHQIDMIPILKGSFNKIEAGVDFVDLKRIPKPINPLK